nr:uncharacterized protein LOC112211609 [Halyomorpha halys]
MGQINVLLGTALGKIRDNRGRWRDLRTLIDSGSQRSFITLDCAHKLDLPLTRNRHRLVGFNNQVIPNVSFEAPCVIAPRQVSKPELNITAIVIERICKDMPTSPIPKDIVDKFRALDLADPHFQHSRSVDFLLGADIFADILRVGNLESGQEAPRALETIFGWILMGPINANSPDEGPHPNTILHSTITPCPQCDDLSRLLTKFWETEQVADMTKADPLDAQCEEHFSSTHSRDEAGRFTVKLPFSGSPPVLNDSKYRALNRFKNLERKFEKDRALHIEYSKVIQEYSDKRYISRAITPGKCYLPHHAVLKDSSSTKLRIVFDASAAPSNGSLNDHLLTGPKLQRDIKDVMLAFRKPRVAISADICQMYQQIKLDPEDCAFQHFYRFRNTDALTEYKFDRLSFGLSCSPFLAMRVLKQLVLDDGENYPETSRALLAHVH